MYTCMANTKRGVRHETLGRLKGTRAFRPAGTSDVQAGELALK